MKGALFTVFTVLVFAAAAESSRQNQAATPQGGARDEYLIIGQSILQSADAMPLVIDVWRQIGTELQTLLPTMRPQALEEFLQEMTMGKTEPAEPQSTDAKNLIASIKRTEKFQALAKLDFPQCPFNDYFTEGLHFHTPDENGIPTLNVSGLHLRRPFAMEINVVDLGLDLDKKFDAAAFGYKTDPVTKFFNFMEPPPSRADRPWEDPD